MQFNSNKGVFVRIQYCQPFILLTKESVRIQYCQPLILLTKESFISDDQKSTLRWQKEDHKICPISFILILSSNQYGYFTPILFPNSFTKWRNLKRTKQGEPNVECQIGT